MLKDGHSAHRYCLRKRKHPSQPFNPDIANAFFRAGMIESWGRGIELIFQACRLNGSPLPEFRNEQSGLWADFGYAKPMAPAETPVEARVALVETPVETPVKTPALILAFLCDHPDAILADVAVAVGKSLRAVERASSRLVKEGKLHFVGPRKGGRWELLP